MLEGPHFTKLEFSLARPTVFELVVFDLFKSHFLSW